MGEREALVELESEARRFAEFYSQGSDGRSTFIIFADKIAAARAGLTPSVAGGWRPIESAPDDEPFLAAIEVRNLGGETWWERHVIWLDDETGEIHRDCEQGWALSDYSHWQPLPAPPTDNPPVDHPVARVNLFDAAPTMDGGGS